jgi:hypothetical protein
MALTLLYFSGVALVPKIVRTMMGCRFKFVELRSEHRTSASIYIQSEIKPYCTALLFRHKSCSSLLQKLDAVILGSHTMRHAQEDVFGFSRG